MELGVHLPLMSAGMPAGLTPPAFGTMRLAGDEVWGPPPDRAAAERLLREARDRGFRCFDTADAYGPGFTDALIASAFGAAAAQLELIEKVGLERPSRDAWVPAGEPRSLVAACERSLRRLGVDRVDLLLLHAVDPAVPIERSVEALAGLAERGLAGAIGVCNVDAEALARARSVADVAAVQNHLNVVDREHLALARACAKAGIRFFGWWPLRGGRLAADARVAELARPVGMTAAELALAWVRARAPAATPIVGITRRDELGQALRGASLDLGDEILAALEETVS